MRKKKIRVVLDTNVFISAILFGGNPSKIVDLTVSEQIEAYTSQDLLNELHRILEEKFSLKVPEVTMILLEVQDVIKIVKPSIRVVLIKEAPADNRILECALEARVDYIVSGDKKHLLPLGTFRKIPIVSPAQFVNLF